MKIEFAERDLESLAGDANYCGRWAHSIVKAFRKRIQQIESATDERDLKALRSLRFERLKGERQHQYSIRLNDQWRLIFELDATQKPKAVLIIGIEDYH